VLHFGKNTAVANAVADAVAAAPCSSAAAAIAQAAVCGKAVVTCGSMHRSFMNNFLVGTQAHHIFRALAAGQC